VLAPRQRGVIQEAEIQRLLDLVGELPGQHTQEMWVSMTGPGRRDAGRRAPRAARHQVRSCAASVRYADVDAHARHRRLRTASRRRREMSSPLICAPSSEASIAITRPRLRALRPVQRAAARHPAEIGALGHARASTRCRDVAGQTQLARSPARRTPPRCVRVHREHRARWNAEYAPPQGSPAARSRTPR